MDDILSKKELKLISFDIFDTLLFRTVKYPTEVFSLMYQQDQARFPSHINRDEWKNIRIKAEEKARKNNETSIGSGEVTLEDIYQQLPDMFKNRELLLALELAMEKEVCFVNSELYDLIKSLKSKTQLKVVLLSDMYLSKEQVLGIIQYNGFDTRLIDKIFMSCEYKTSKRKKGLYDIVLEQYGLTAHEMLHVGDNEFSDISCAKQMGIHTHLYDVISGSRERHPFLELEALKFGDCATEIYALRNLAAQKGESLGEDAELWQKIGSMILGPLFTYGIEWVLDLAEANDVDAIYPMMREGAFLSEMLGVASQYRKQRFSIKPIFVSRKALFLPSLVAEGLDSQQVDYLLGTFGLRVRDVFDVLEINEYAHHFQDFLDLETIEARNTMNGQNSVFSQLKSFLIQDDIRSVVHEKATIASTCLMQYLGEIGLTKRSITLDLGCRGTMQHSLERVLRKNGLNNQNIHLLLLGKEETLRGILDEVDIRGFIGTFGRNRGLIGQIFIRLLELFTMCEQGTTIGYEKKGPLVQPVLEAVNYPFDKQMTQMRWAQQGILDFQQEYFRTGQKKLRMCTMKNKEADLIKPIARFFSVPTHEEVMGLGQWHYDQNFGAQQMWKVIDADYTDRLHQEGLENYLVENNGRSVEWYPGMLVLADPYIFMKRYYTEINAIERLKRVLLAEKTLREFQDAPSIVIVGAGSAGRDVFNYLRFGQAGFVVEAFIDNNPNLQGKDIRGIPIKSFADEFKSDCYLIGSLAFSTELREQVIREKGNHVRIVSI
jgi:HAD superfamily hydrolase (TIGR01549 family)